MGLAKVVELIEELEKELKKSHKLPGTSITRVLCDVRLLEKDGIKLPPTDRPRESIMCWSVGVGELNAPKAFFRGLTIQDALENAVKGYKKRGPEVIKFINEEDTP